MIVYLGHPIDQAGEHTSRIAHQATVARNILTSDGCSVYSPANAWQAATPMPAAIQELNLGALLMCDAALFIMPENVSSLGVPFELAYAHMYGIPTVIVRGAETSNRMRDQSALLAYLEDAAIFGITDLHPAAHYTAQVAKAAHAANIASAHADATGDNGDTNERTEQ